MKKRIVYSLDYDGCGSILSEENHNHFTNFIRDQLHRLLNDPKNESLRNLFEKKELLQNENELNHLIKSVIKETATLLEKKLFQLSADTSVTLMVGSNRQNHGDDVFNSFHNRTISCFTAYEALAQRLNLDFCKFLLSDIYDANGLREVPREIGSTMNSSNKPDINCLKGKTEEAIREYIEPFCENPPFSDKVRLISHQLKHVASNLHTEAEPASFIFLDDREDIINSLINKIEIIDKDIPKKLDIKLIQFNSILGVLNNVIRHVKEQKPVLVIKEMYSREKQASELLTHSIHGKKRKREEMQPSAAMEPQILPSP